MQKLGSTTPKVTVLMAVYNGQRYLREAIESILHQTYTGFEFLIINDGSTDDSREIILSYDDPRIRLADNRTNVGLTKSLNRGSEMARGSLIARQDADDVSHSTRLEEQVAFMDVYPEVAVLGTQVRYIDENGRSVRSVGWEKAVTEVGIRWQLMFDSPVVHSSVMFRRSVVWDELRGYNETFVTSQDFELWSRVAVKHGVRNLPQVLVDLRLHPKSASANYQDRHVRQVESVFLSNLRRSLNSLEVPGEWPSLWIGITNCHALGEIDEPGRALGLIDTLYTRFLAVHPDAASNMEIRRHMAGKLAYVACYLAPRDRLASIRTYARACRNNIKTAGVIAIKYLALLLFGRWVHRVFRPCVRLTRRNKNNRGPKRGTVKGVGHARKLYP